MYCPYRSSIGPVYTALSERYGIANYGMKFESIWFLFECTFHYTCVKQPSSTVPISQVSSSLWWSSSTFVNIVFKKRRQQMIRRSVWCYFYLFFSNFSYLRLIFPLCHVYLYISWKAVEYPSCVLILPHHLHHNFQSKQMLFR